MCKVAKITVGIVAVSAVACLVVHRRVVAAVLKGRPIPELPESHKAWHPCAKA